MMAKKMERASILSLANDAYVNLAPEISLNSWLDHRTSRLPQVAVKLSGQPVVSRMNFLLVSNKRPGLRANKCRVYG